MRAALRKPMLAGLSALAVACTESSAPEHDDVSAVVDAAPPALDAAHSQPTFAPTFDAIYSEVIAAHNCLLGLCHGAGASGGGLTLFPRSRARDNLLVRSTGFECQALGLAGIDPGHPDTSLLWLKLRPEAPCGLRMPPDGRLDPRHAEQVRSWITAGAPVD